MGATTNEPVKRERIISVDALRGFDMFFIVGMEEIFAAISAMVVMTPSLNDRVQHAEWAGFHFYDLIFPLFAFIVGVSLVFSLDKSIDQAGKAATTGKIIKRSVILYLLGVIVYGGIGGGIEQVRLMGVLQRLAFCFCAAALLYVWASSRQILAAIIVILISYWALLTFVPVPGGVAGSFAEGQNFTNWFDKMYLPFRKWDGDHDPEGLLSTFPAIATSLLGVFAGRLLKNPHVLPQRKVAWLFAWGLGGIVLGLLWHLQFPIIKKLWTSSFVLLTAGCSSVLLALFYQVIDVWRYQRWCQPFVWIGTNAITIYLLFHFVKLTDLARCFVGGEVNEFLEQRHAGLGELATAALTLMFSFAICRFLYRRGIFLRV